ncbi:STAS/SEC14 domain-containing protein [Marivita sp.]|uniref:STAS/SEC14 domain-containing protein n=1 Tax=Marivita sp. TaxID=2003365 RepID=UPI0025C1FED9|nr:STAS/SEC14 domain-containing protein [Marivita sp.]
MLKITKPEPNRIDLDLSGKITSEEMASGLDDLLEKSQDVNAGRMLYTISSFAFPDLSAIAVEMARLPKLFSLLARFDRCAVLSDAAWIRTAAEVEGGFLPGIDFKAFDLSARDQAEAWLKSGVS